MIAIHIEIDRSIYVGTLSHNTELLSTNQHDAVGAKVGVSECPVEMVMVVVVVQDDGAAHA